MPRPAAAFLASLAFATSAFAAEPEAKLSLKTMTAQMRYSESELVVKPGQPVKLTFENGDDLPHNLVICKPGTDVIAMTMKQMENAEAALKRNWLPDDPRILFHSRMLNPHEKDELSFTAPDKPGAYPFVCTFPGHAMTMKGVLKVERAGEIFSELSFKLYHGEWTKLPEFDALPVHREGKIEDRLIQVKLDDYKNDFGIVFTGKLIAPKEGLYTFYLTSDDGGRVLVDGQQVAEYDGIHPAGAIKEGKVKLTAGEHSYRLEYFQAAGNIELFAGWSGPGFSPTPLSKWAPDDWQLAAKNKGKRKDESTGMPLVVSSEPIVYRNFIANAGQRSIGVGYPGNVNLAWSAESMNLALVWRGAFIDAARHWNGRGGGAQPPLGYDVQQPAGELLPALAVLASAEAAWPEYAKGEPFPGYQWQGYHLDAARRPTFRYSWQGVQVEDSFEPSSDAVKQPGQTHLTRRVKLSSAQPLPPGSHFLLAAGNVKPGAAGDEFIIGDLLRLKVAMSGSLLRTSNGKPQLLLPLNLAGKGELTLTMSYSFTK